MYPCRRQVVLGPCDTYEEHAAVKLRNIAVLTLSVVGVTALAVASVVPGWDALRLVGMAAFAIVATDLLSRSSDRP